MAESVVEDRPGTQPRFYCHVCKQEFTDITQEYTCPVCSDGFIEELHDAEPSPSSGGQATASMEVDVLELLNTGLREAAGFVGDGSGGSGGHPFRLLRQQAADPRSRPRRPSGHHHHHSVLRMGPPSHPSGSGGQVAAGSADGSPAPAMINAYDQLIRDFFAYVGGPGVANRGGTVTGGGQLVGGGSGGGANGRRLITAGAPGRADQLTLTPMFFVGNPGDYVWGHDGLDSVITLMLNQLEPTGPPPMTAAKIDEIPKCEIGQEELDKKMQCSVCLEDYQLQEQARKLPCAHIFHETCILPWLELHGTCPICRDTFTEGGEQEQGDDAGYEAMDTDTANRFENLISDIQQRPGVIDALAAHLPRSGAGVIGSSVPNTSGGGAPTAVSNSNSTSNHTIGADSSHSRSNAISSQSAETQTNTGTEANVAPRNNLNFHLDDGLD